MTYKTWSLVHAKGTVEPLLHSEALAFTGLRRGSSCSQHASARYCCKVVPSASCHSTVVKQHLLPQVSDAAAAVYNKIVPSAEAKEPTDSEARRHLHRAGDAAKDAGEDIKTSAYEVKEALKDGARGYGNNLADK